MPRHVYLLAALFLPLAPLGVAARDIYVNNIGGDDRWSGSSSASLIGEGPVRTITRALELAAAGDRIVLANTGAAYREPISLSAAKHCGLAVQPFVIEGNGAILDGSLPVPPLAWQFYRDTIFRFQPRRLGYQQLFLNGRPAKRVPPGPDRDVPKLQPLEWCLLDGVIYFAVESDRSPNDYDLTYAAMQTGITLYHVHDVAITHLTVQGFQLDGINAHDGVRNCVLSEVVVRGNGRAGVCSAGCSHIELHGSLVGDNGAAQVWAEGLSSTEVVASELLENTAPARVQRGEGRILIDGQSGP